MNFLSLPKIDFDPKRRTFLAASALALPSVFLFGATNLPQENGKEFSITISRYGKVYTIPFLENNKIITDGYELISRVMGDFHTLQAVPMDVNLILTLSRAQEWLKKNGYQKPIILNSGFRSISTNAMTEGAVRNSMHLYGKAVDVVFDGLAPLSSARILRFFGATGIGVYKNFVHADTGRLRAWYG